MPSPTAETAYDVETTLTFPGFASVAVTGATPTAGSFDAGTGIWSIASLTPGVSQTLQVTITTPPTPPDVLTAQVVAAAEQNDPDTTNNLDSVSVGLGGFFYSLAPCRLVDTRLADGPYGGPALAPGLSRVVAADAGGCGIPADARAVALNVTVVNAEAAGHLTVSEAGIGATDTSVLNFAAGQTRANNTVVELDGSGQFTVTNASAGSSHVVVDVSGYFR